MFSLPFSSTPGEAAPQEESKMTAPSKTSKRSRRRRNMKSRKTQVEPVVSEQKSNKTKKQHDAPMTKGDLYFALDCEMVGTGPDGYDSAVARVTVVNWENKVVLDTFVQVPVPVTDYRSHISGIQPADIESEGAMTFDEARSAVESIIRGKILIGHGLENDLCALSLTHPYCDVRDTATYVPFMREALDYESGKVMMQSRKLRDLSWEQLGRQIQVDGVAHSPIEDAIAALDLYKSARKEWEQQLSVQQMERIRQAENQRRAKSLFFSSPASAMTPTTASNIGMYDPNVGMGYSYGGPFGPAIPGFTPAPPGADTQISEDQPAPSASSWRWYPTLRKTRPSQDAIPEDSTQEVSETTQQAVPSQRSGFFFLRKSKGLPQDRSDHLDHALSAETDNTTVCTETDSAYEGVSELDSSVKDGFTPDYKFLQETNWSQSFQVVDFEASRRLREQHRQFETLFDPPSEQQQQGEYYYEEDYEYFGNTNADWYRRDDQEPTRARFTSI